MNKDEMKTYPTWAIQRIDGDESPFDVEAFRKQVNFLGGDGNDLARYGYPPMSDFVPLIQKIYDLVSPFA